MKMEIMETKRIIIIVMLLVNICACTTQNLKPVKGGVYVSNQLLKNKAISYDTIYPILAVRIDTIVNSNLLLVKYRFGIESVMDVDFEYQASCNCYSSQEKILFAPHGLQKENVFLKFVDTKELILYYIKDGNINTYKYIITYIDKVNQNTNRDIYYAEESFKLFNK